MRIFSELSTDEALEVVLQIAQPITNLIDDEAFVKEMQKAMPKGETTRIAMQRFGLAKIVKLLNIALKPRGRVRNSRTVQRPDGGRNRQAEFPYHLQAGCRPVER